MEVIDKTKKLEFLKEQMEILRQKATDMTVGNYMTLYNYYSKKLEKINDRSLPSFDNEIPCNLKVKSHGRIN